MAKGSVFIVGAGPGDPKLLTLRAYELIMNADVVIFDRLVSKAILDLIPSTVNKVCKQETQQEINELMISEAKAGKQVVRLKGGDPLFFARSIDELRALRDINIDFEIVPGITSAFAAPAYAGVPLTDRKYASSVTIVTGHEAASKRSKIKWSQLAKVETLVILMGVEAFPKIARELISAGADRSTSVVAIERGTTEKQKTFLCTLGEAMEGEIYEKIKSPSVIVVGKVATFAKELDWYHLNSLYVSPLLQGTTVLEEKG